MAGEEILVIDDNASTRQLLKAVLEKKGYNIALAATTHEAFEKVKREQPNLIILLDIDGSKLLEFINQESQLTLVPVMILTSKKELENKFHNVLLGDMEQLTKSKQWENLTANVDNVFDLHNTKIKDHNKSNDQESLRRLLQYIKQKNISQLTPIVRKEAKLGYEYPQAAKILQLDVIGEEILTLERLAEEKHLDRVIYDIIHICPFCGHHDLNYREICPQCKSIEIESFNVIMHIKCGHRALEYEFNRNGKKICPACNRSLTGEGIDYEKANRSVFRCFTCRKKFSNSVVNCRCINCNQLFDTSKAIKKKIYSYQFQKIDENIAEDLALLQKYIKKAPSPTKPTKKSPKPHSPLQTDFAEMGLETLNWQLLTHQLRHEIKRSRKNNLKFSLLKLSFLREDGLDLDVDNTLPKPVLRKLILILKKCLRDLDIICIKNPMEYVILLPETPLSMAKILGERIHNYFDQLKLPITAEISLSGYPEDGKEAGELLEVINLNLAILNPDNSH
ncbi:MAG: response regulator [bacterium]